MNKHKIKNLKIEKIKIVYSKLLYNLREYWSVIVIFVFFVLLNLIDLKLLPDFLYVKNTYAFIEILSIISTILATILGIVIAFFILSLDMLRKTYSNYGIRLFFENKIVKNIIGKFFLGLIFSLLTLFRVEQTEINISTISLNLVNFNIIYFIYCIFFIIFKSKRIILSSISKDKIKELVRKITLNEFFPFHTGGIICTKEDADNEKKYKKIEENPLYIIRDIAINNIRGGDKYLPHYILDELLNDLKNKLEETKNNPIFARDVINLYSYIFSNIIKNAIEEKNEGIIYKYIYIYEVINDYVARNKLKWSLLIEMNSEFKNNAFLIINKRLTEPSIQLINSLTRVAINQIENNIPSEDELPELKYRYSLTNEWKPANYDQWSQWNNIFREPLWILHSCAEYIINIKNTSLSSSLLFSYRALLFKYLEIEKIGELQRAYLIENALYDLNSVSIELAKNNLYPQYMDFQLAGIDIYTFTEKPSYFRESVIKTYADFVINIVELKIFNLRDILGLVSNAIFFAQNIEKDIFYKEAIIYILEITDQIRAKLESYLVEGSKEIYLNLFRVVEQLNNTIEIKNYDFINEKVRYVLNKFKNIEKIDEEISKKRIIWPDLKNNK